MPHQSPGKDQAPANPRRCGLRREAKRHAAFAQPMTPAPQTLREKRCSGYRLATALQNAVVETKSSWTARRFCKMPEKILTAFPNDKDFILSSWLPSHFLLKLFAAKRCRAGGPWYAVGN